MVRTRLAPLGAEVEICKHAKTARTWGLINIFWVSGSDSVPPDVLYILTPFGIGREQP